MKKFVILVRDETGVTVIEYGLIAALISVVCIVGMTAVGTQLQAVYSAVSTAITPALAGGLRLLLCALFPYLSFTDGAHPPNKRKQ